MGGIRNQKTTTSTLAMAALLCAVCGTAKAQTPAELAYCNRLAAYYDQYAPRGEEGPRAGGIDRIVGFERCRKGEVAAGTAQLQNAIRQLGFEPPKN